MISCSTAQSGTCFAWTEPNQTLWMEQRLSTFLLCKENNCTFAYFTYLAFLVRLSLCKSQPVYGLCYYFMMHRGIASSLQKILPKLVPKNNFFETYRACVITLRNAPEWPLLRERLDLRLTELIKSTCWDIFPPKVFLAQCNPPKLGSILRR